MKDKILCVACGLLFASQLSHADDPVKRVRSGHNLLEDTNLKHADLPIGGLAFASIDGQPIYLD